MVTFATYVKLAYEVADQKGATLSGPGTQDENQQFMSMLADVYNENNHSEASKQAARRFLEEEIVVG
jgi:hypothetical protein